MPVRACTFGSLRAQRSPADEQRRFRLKEVRILLARLSPVLFGDAEVLQHGFRSQETEDGRGVIQRCERRGPEQRQHLLRDP